LFSFNEKSKEIDTLYIIIINKQKVMIVRKSAYLIVSSDPCTLCIRAAVAYVQPKKERKMKMSMSMSMSMCNWKQRRRKKKTWWFHQKEVVVEKLKLTEEEELVSHHC